MKFFRPRIKKIEFNTKRQIITSIGLAALLCGMVAVTGYMNFHSKAAVETDGNWHDCNGAVDNDPAHHSSDVNDADPAHHMGQVCNGNQEAWGKTPTTSDTAKTTDTVSSADSTEITGPQIPAAIAESIMRAQSVIANTIQPASANDPFGGAKLYINPNNDPSNYVRQNNGNSNAKLMEKIASQPEVEWLGNWNSNISGDVANMMNTIDSQGALPVFVVYDIPFRDCGGYSAGGVNDASSYHNWISQIANTIGARKAVIILEPDAVTLTDCLSVSQKSDRNAMLTDAVKQFKSQGNTAVYIDAGHPDWIAPADLAARLKAAGEDMADGFALNIANFYTNDQNAAYGKQISDLLGGKHFIVDTGRSGSGPASGDAWCNPSGRSLGTPPTTNTGNSLIDAYLWVKGPGGSDGNCNGGPSAGQFWPDYALGLAQRTNW
ncbi:MAG TPA: glycoside hydrolase family 6 protein [Patescibacteria group bacterium]|nr:glycoside hydrolase family 6 protein [Patescibacteria group bacterium]